MAAVKPGGIVVSVVDLLDPAVVRARGIRFERLSSVPSGEQLAVFAVARRTQEAPAARADDLPAGRGAQAQEESRAGHVRGKLVLAL